MRPVRPAARGAALALALGLALGPAGAVRAYPIDAYPETGIARLEAFRLVQRGEMPGRILYWGAQLYSSEIKLRLTDRPDFRIPPPDPAFTASIVKLLGEDAGGYGLAVLDITDPAAPLYAAHNADRLQNPGSVGKVVVALAFFQALADAFPEVEARKSLLRETRVTADAFIRTDTHIVPFWNVGDPEYERRPIREGDVANLYTWLDWMLSSSSNAAAAELQSQLLLLRHFGKAYPPPQEEAERFWRETSRAELSRLFLDAMIAPLTRNGLSPERLRQGSFFSREGKRRVPGTSSHATAEELLRYMVKMEKGALVDPWSSLELKKLLYITDKRIRYASSPVLWDWAVYFKSGSWYGCKPEPGFTCEKYKGNLRNFMNSMTMVESVDQSQDLHYIAVVLSNVLRKNSSELHRDLGRQVHELLLQMHGEPLPEDVPELTPSQASEAEGEPEGTPDDETF